MRNLKRALCFALAAVMVLGLMITGAGAASTYDNFTDKDEIVHQEAVNTMVSLGVISGKEDGSYYDPSAIVTRAEMTKVVAVALNGGKDPVFSDNDKTTFSDTQGHWAEKYIAYCVRQNIVAGRGDNSFGPDDPLTGSACAKMFLCALGYRADLEGFVNVGSNWEMNVNIKANQDAKLYNGLSDITASDPLTRDSMAQMLYNAVQADEVTYQNLYGDYSGVIQARPTDTMLWNRFQVRKVTGILMSNDVLSVDGSVALENRSRIDVKSVSGYDADNTGGSNNNAGNLFGKHQYNVSTSDEMVGQEVVIYVQFQDYLSPNSNNAVVIGEAILTDNNTVVETTGRLKDAAAVRTALRDGGLTGLSSTAVAACYTEGEPRIGTTTNSGITDDIASVIDSRSKSDTNEYYKRSAGIFQRFIDNSGDGVADYIVQVVPVLSSVNAVKTSDYTFTGVNGGNDIPKDDVVTELDLARADVVLITQYADGNYYVEAPETVEGRVTAYNTNNNTVTIDGTAYGNSGGKMLRVSGADQFLDVDMVDNTYIFYLDPYGNVLGSIETDSVLGNYCVVTGYSRSGNSRMGYSGTVKVIMQDGTTGTYSVNMASTAVRLGIANSSASTLAKETALATNDYFSDDANDTSKGTLLVDHLFSYTLDNNVITLARPYHVNDRYTSNYMASGVLNTDARLSQAVRTGVTALSRNQATYTLAGSTAANNSGSIVANDSTVFFVKDKDSGYYVIEGLSRLPVGGITLAGINDPANSPVRGNASDDTISYTPAGNGTQVARAIFVTTNTKFKSARDFVYVTNKYTKTTNSGTDAYTFDVVNMNGEVSQMTTTDNINTIKETVREYYKDGSYISFEGPDKDDNPYTPEKAVYVRSINGNTVTLVSKDGTWSDSYRIDGSTKIWDVQGDAPVSVSTLSENDLVAIKLDLESNNKGVIEAAFIYDIFDGKTSGGGHDFNWDSTGFKDAYTSDSLRTIQEMLNEGKNVVVHGPYDLTAKQGSLRIPAGQTLLFENDLTASATYRITGAGTLLVGGNYSVAGTVSVDTEVKGNMSLTGATTITSDVAVGSAVNLGTSQTLTVNSGSTLDVTGNITGTGSTLVADGTVKCANISDPTGTITVNSPSSLHLTGSLSIGTLNIGTGGNGTVTVGSTATISVALNLNRGSLTISGTSATVTGTLTVAAGTTLSAANADVTVDGTGAKEIASDDVELKSASFAGSGNVTISGNIESKDTTFATSGTVTVSGAITGETATFGTDAGTPSSVTVSGEVSVTGAVTGSATITVEGSMNAGSITEGTKLNVTEEGEVAIEASNNSATIGGDGVSLSGTYDAAISIAANSKVAANATLTINGKVTGLNNLTGNTGSKVVFGTAADFTGIEDPVTTFKYMVDETATEFTGLDALKGQTFTWNGTDAFIMAASTETPTISGTEASFLPGSTIFGSGTGVTGEVSEDGHTINVKINNGTLRTWLSTAENFNKIGTSEMFHTPSAYFAVCYSFPANATFVSLKVDGTQISDGDLDWKDGSYEGGVGDWYSFVQAVNKSGEPASVQSVQLKPEGTTTNTITITWTVLGKEVTETYTLVRTVTGAPGDPIPAPGAGGSGGASV